MLLSSLAYLTADFNIFRWTDRQTDKTDCLLSLWACSSQLVLIVLFFLYCHQLYPAGFVCGNLPGIRTTVHNPAGCPVCD